MLFLKVIRDLSKISANESEHILSRRCCLWRFAELLLFVNFEKKYVKKFEQSKCEEEPIAPSPKRQNQKNTPPATATIKSTKNRQATLATALGNPIPISTIQIASATGKKQFEIDS